MAGVPVLIHILVWTLYGVPLSAYRPLVNDEVAYWHQAQTFIRAGFAGGYYTVDELTNASGITPFGPHGPGFPVLYGLAGAAFGWARHSVVLLNLTAIAIAGAVWLSLARLGLARRLLSGLMLVTFWHLVFWAPTGMQEGLHHAGAIAMAALFAYALNAEADGLRLRPSLGRGWVLVAGWLTLAVLSFVRPSWILLLPLWAIVTTRGASRSVVVATVAASLVLGAAIVFAYSRTTAPYASGFFFLRAFGLSLGVESLAGNALDNIRRIGRLDQFEPIELLHRYQYWTFLAATIAIATIGVWKARAGTAPRPAMHALVVSTAMFTALAAMFVLYEFASLAEHRVLSAFFLFGALLCLAAPGRAGVVLASLLIASNIAFAGVALRDLEAVHRDHFDWDPRRLMELERAIDGKLVYRPGVSRWCNTLLTAQYPPELIAIPAGIGLSVLQKPEEMTHSLRSRYLLLDDRARSRFVVPLHLDPIATLSYGTLFENQDAGCE